MSLTVNQRTTRLQRRLNELRFWIDREWIDLSHWTFDGAPLALGEAWPSREGVLHFEHPTVSVPDSWDLDDTRLVLDLGGEALVRVRYEDGSEEQFGHDPNHLRYPLRQRSLSVRASAVARLPFGVPARDARLRTARLVLTDPVVERLVRQIRLLVEAIRALDEHDVVDPLISAGERAINGLDWPSETRTYLSRTQASSDMQSIWELPSNLDPHPPALDDEQRAGVRAAGERLDQDLRDLLGRYPRQGNIALVGHAHLDLAWLWPLDETRRKAQRTFSTIAGLIERYPEFRFNQSSAQIYAFVERDDPELFSRVQQEVAGGQWEPVGGMWVEPDINMPCGESLTRQLLYGQRYFQQAFGTMHTVCWLPDCFGFSPALPQLLRGAGIENFFTIKLTWSESNRFPYDLFWWEGLDGSRVLAHMFDNPGDVGTDLSGYNADPGPWSLVKTWQNFRGKDRYDESLLSIGFGDGGGGVTTEMLEQARALEPFPAIPAIAFTSVRDFYARMRAGVEGKELPVWLGEMYLELHRGTLTTQGRTKYLHRRAERELVAAEAVASFHHLLGGPAPSSLEEHWRVLLRNEFHDILPGSSVREVYQEAERELAGVVDAARSVSDGQMADLAERIVPGGDRPGILAFNPDLSPRPVRIEMDEQFPGAQAVEGGSVLTGRQQVPGLGATLVTEGSAGENVTVSPEHLENEYIRVTLGADGSLTSVFDRVTGREVLAERGNQLWVYVDKPPAWDAWDLDREYIRDGEELTGVESMTVIEHGPHRAAIRIVRRFRQSTITQDIRLWANSPRLEFKTTLDWHDRRRLLKARFPLAIRSARATFETAFGVIERSTHRNTSWDTARFEVVAHRFADLAEPGYGVALLNDGKYGHHALGNELGISLLRSPTFPDPLADEGTQTFTYALLPHRGSWLEGGVLMEAEDLNRPLLTRLVSTDGDGSRSWRGIELEGLPLGLGSVKALEDGSGLILRAYEPEGARGNATLDLPSGWTADAGTDLLERETGQADFSFTPFQVRSWRLRSTE